MGLLYKNLNERLKVFYRSDFVKICFVGSSGGHLFQLYMLKRFWKNKERFWCTFDKEDARFLLDGETLYPVYYPSNRSVKALFINTHRAIKILREEKPDIIISCGAAPAIPFFIVGKLMGIKTIYLEVFDRVFKPTISGKICYIFSDRFIVQWEELKNVYPKAIYLGTVF